jgi:hypothetical protein
MCAPEKGNWIDRDKVLMVLTKFDVKKVIFYSPILFNISSIFVEALRYQRVS